MITPSFVQIMPLGAKSGTTPEVTYSTKTQLKRNWGYSLHVDFVDIMFGNFSMLSLNETADLLNFLAGFRGKLWFPLRFINMILRWATQGLWALL